MPISKVEKRNEARKNAEATKANKKARATKSAASPVNTTNKKASVKRK